MRARQTPFSLPFTIDVVLLTTAGNALAVLLQRDAAKRGARAGWSLPHDAPANAENIDGAAKRIARAALHADASWMEQLAAFSGARRNAARGTLSVAYLGLVPSANLPVGGDMAWFSVASLPRMTVQQGEIVAAAQQAIRERMDYAPIAFRLLPPTFTLSELQTVYELLSGRKLHKASFRRALQAATLVEPVNEWRGEGRGRPARLYRYSPRKRKKARHSIRFDLLG